MSELLGSEIRGRSLWHQAAYDEAIKWSRTIVSELDKNDLPHRWQLLSAEKDLLTTFLAGEISRKRGAEHQRVVNQAQTLTTIDAKPAVKMAKARLQAQDDVATDFFEKAAEQQKQNRWKNLTSTAQNVMVDIILKQHPDYSKEGARALISSNNPQILAALERAIDQVDVARDLRRLANLLCSAMMGKLDIKLTGDHLPKSNNWAVQVANNFQFSVKR